jgi:hypothetical protein
LEAFISILFSVAHLLREFRAVFIVYSKVLCCLALFLVEVLMTPSWAYISILVLVFLTVFGRSMYTLKSVVLVTARWGSPTFVCLYFQKVLPYLTLFHLCSKNLENPASMFPAVFMFLSFLISLALHMES